MELRQKLTPKVLAKLAGVPLRARVMVEGHYSGLHRSRMRGASIEFADHREYTPGDDTRHIDWRVYARTDRHFIKQFEAETNLFVYIAVDASASMAYGRPQSKAEYACLLAAALAYLAWRQHDAPALAIFSSELEAFIPPRTQQAHLSNLIEAMEALRPSRRTDFRRCMSDLAAALRRPGLLVVISDFWAEPDDVLSSLRHFRARGHDVMALQVLTPDELNFPFRQAAVFVEPETGLRVPASGAVAEAYRRAVQQHLEALGGGLRSAGIDWHLCTTDRPFEVSLAAVLSRRAVR